jgi:hypothetical protein
MAMAAFIDHWAMTLKDGQSAALFAWLERNESKLAAAFPPGSQWLGTYAEVIGGNSQNWWHVMIGHQNYGGLDSVADASRDQKAEFGRLITELFGFFDQTSAARSARWLYRAAPNIVVWE